MSLFDCLQALKNIVLRECFISQPVPLTAFVVKGFEYYCQLETTP